MTTEQYLQWPPQEIKCTHPPKLLLPQSTMASSMLLETAPALCYPLNHVQALLSSLMAGIG